MSKRFDQLSAKHRALLERCALQRAHLGETANDIDAQLGNVDRSVAVVRRIVSQPVLIVGGIALVVLAGPKRLLRFASRAVLFYSTARRVAGLVRARREIGS
jgi:hypothetical protein